MECQSAACNGGVVAMCPNLTVVWLQVEHPMWVQPCGVTQCREGCHMGHVRVVRLHVERPCGGTVVWVLCACMWSCEPRCWPTPVCVSVTAGGVFA